ncbi:hypothetical protein RU639_009924 [Aspergillus parasiticus]
MTTVSNTTLADKNQAYFNCAAKSVFKYKWGNLLAPIVQPTNPPLDDEELDSFDLVAICMALHHVEDIQIATQHLASRLRPGGVFSIIDWATRDSLAMHEHASPDAVHPEHPAAHTISHDSFTQEQIMSPVLAVGRCNCSGLELPSYDSM